MPTSIQTMKRTLAAAGTSSEKVRLIVAYADKMADPHYSRDDVFAVLSLVKQEVLHMVLVEQQPQDVITKVTKTGLRVSIGGAALEFTREAASLLQKRPGKTAAKRPAAKMAGTAKKAGKRAAAKKVAKAGR